MATMEKVGFGEKTNEEKQECPVNKLELPNAEESTEEKKGFFKSLGKWGKIGICALGTLVVGGLGYLAVSLLGGKDDDEPAAIEAAPEETKE